MKHLTTKQGDVFLVDDDVFALFGGLKWSTLNSGRYKYARTRVWAAGRDRHILLHRAIMSATRGFVVDHINGDTKDNRRENMRVCTQGENLAHRVKLSENNTSGVTGVSWFKQTGRWRAQMTLRGKPVNIGYFVDKQDAILARKEAERKYFGDFAPSA